MAINSRNHSRRFSAAGLILFGLILGLVGGLSYAWIVAPVQYFDASPARFSNRYKEEYIFLVSRSYAANQDLEQAQRRLAALEEPNVNQTVGLLLERYLRARNDPEKIRTLAALARDLGVEGNVVALFAPPSDQPPTETPTATPTAVTNPTPTPVPTFTQPAPPPTVSPTKPPTPSPTPFLIYRLLNQERLCPPDEPAPRIEVRTWDALLNPLPGVEVLVQWDNGADHFFTGFKPAQGLDYGDFAMDEGVSYTVNLAEGSPEASGLRIEPCPDTGLPGGWQLTFQNLVQRANE